MPLLPSDALPLLIPLLYGITALVLLRARASAATSWQAGHAATATALVAAVALLPSLHGPRLVMVPLITVLGGLILRFSARYLDGATEQPRYVAWFLLTLAGASVVVTTGDLVVLALGWTLTSLALHQLLSLGDQRPATELMAHKKFILSRLADVVILSGVALIVGGAGSSRIADILSMAARAATLPTALAAGATCLAVGVILRSAQLPFHGWLLQVMEAPTPISALLHAGIVNLGAFVLIALAPLMGSAPVAQALLVVAGTSTAILAAIAMSAQSTVKGALAWSTCAQMGFVLIECGLGAYDLALLHLVAHALYKAHAFLNSGRAVRTATVQWRTVSHPHPLQWLAAAVLSGAIVAATLQLVHGTDLSHGATLVGGLVVALAATPALAYLRPRDGWRAMRSALTVGLGLPLLYAAAHLVLTPLAPARMPVMVPTAMVAAVLLAFVGLFVTHVVVTTAPSHRVARLLYPHAVHGFHLDTVFTRMTFRLWPPRRARTERRVPAPSASPLTEQAA